MISRCWSGRACGCIFRLTRSGGHWDSWWRRCSRCSSPFTIIPRTKSWRHPGSALVYAALRVLLDEGPGPWRHALLGAVMGLALLAKASLLVVAAAVGFALFVRILLAIRTGGWQRRAVHLGVTLVVCLVVSGWYYALVWAHFGKPLVASFDPVTGFRWWQDPGYRMAADYLRFGLSFSNPLYSAASSLWDGYYTTLWGDGACSGASSAVFCPPWSYERMTLGYWLAIVPMLGIVAGAFAILTAFARQPIPWLLLIAVIGGTLFAMLALVTTIPQYSLAKSFYGLMALVPLAALAGWGLDWMSGPQRWRSGLVWFFMLTWALNAYATFWVQDRASTRAAMGAGWLADGDVRGLAELRAALERDERQPLAASSSETCCSTRPESPGLEVARWLGSGGSARVRCVVDALRAVTKYSGPSRRSGRRSGWIGLSAGPAADRRLRCAKPRRWARAYREVLRTIHSTRTASTAR